MAYVGPDLDEAVSPAAPSGKPEKVEPEEAKPSKEADKAADEDEEKKPPEKDEEAEKDEEKKDEKKDEKKKPEDEDEKLSKGHATLAKREKKLLERKAELEGAVAQERAEVTRERQKLEGIVAELRPRIAKLERFEAALQDHEELLKFLEEAGVTPDLIVERTKAHLTPEGKRLAKLEAEHAATAKELAERKAAEAKQAQEAERGALYREFIEESASPDDYPFLNLLYRGPQILRQGLDVVEELRKEGRTASNKQILKYLEDQAEKHTRANPELLNKVASRLGLAQQSNGDGSHAKKAGNARTITESLSGPRTSIRRDPDEVSEEEAEAAAEEALRKAIRADRSASA